MGENFKHLKRRYKVRASAISAALSCCLAVTVACALAVVLRLCGVNLHWALYIPIGAGVAAALFYPLYRAFAPDDVKLAKLLDEQLHLNQKVQTMVEYSNAEGVLAEMQREQAEGALAAARPKKFNAQGLLKFAFIPVLAAAMLFAGIFTPLTKSGGVIDEPYEITDYQKTSLEKLVSDVQSSKLKPSLKAGFTGVLEGLLESLQDSSFQSVMRQRVTEAVAVIDGAVAADNTYLRLATALSDSEEALKLAKKLSDAANAYGSGRIADMRAVEERRKQLDVNVEEKLQGWLTSYAAQLSQTEGGASSQKDAIAASLTELSSALSTRLAQYKAEVENAGGETDGLYSAMQALAARAASFAGKKEDYLTAERYAEEVQAALSSALAEAIQPLAQQAYGLLMNDYVRTRLRSIFGISLPPWQTELSIKPQEGEGGGDDSQSGNPGGGGGGTGEELSGSDDAVIDPDTGKPVRYTVLLERYRNGALERIAEGAAPEEVAKYIKQYFDKLSSYQSEQ